MKNYINDKIFLEKFYQLVELSLGDKKILLTPSIQGRVMTSTSNGDKGYSYGWINYDLISSGKLHPNCNNWGGEDRYWLGPEGGQNALFFAPGTSTSFKMEDWHAPTLIDTESWELTSHSKTKATFSTSKVLTNYNNYKFDCRLDREVSILTDNEIRAALGIELDENTETVGFISKNSLTNIGSNKWDKDSGAISIWILGQFIPSDNNKVILPVKESADSEVNDYYFGKIPADRLEKRGNCYYFKGDGDFRSKLGIPHDMTIPLVMALDEDNEILTVVKFSFDNQATEYVNSLWAMQDEPFKGDVINSYNDGASEGGEKFGGFYEIESSSKALFLNPQETHTHHSTTIHIKGNLESLKQIINKLGF